MKKIIFLFLFHKNRQKQHMSYFTKEGKTALHPPIIIRRPPRPVSTELRKWMVTRPRKRIWTFHEIFKNFVKLHIQLAIWWESCAILEKNYEPNWFIDPYLLLLLAKLSLLFFGKAESQNIKNHSRKNKKRIIKNKSPENFCRILFNFLHIIYKKK